MAYVQLGLVQIEVRLVTCAECIRGGAWVAPCVGGVVPLACSAVTRVRVRPGATILHISQACNSNSRPAYPYQQTSGLGFSFWPGSRSTNGLLCNGRCQVVCPATWRFQHVASCAVHVAMGNASWRLLPHISVRTSETYAPSHCSSPCRMCGSRGGAWVGLCLRILLQCRG